MLGYQIINTNYNHYKQVQWKHEMQAGEEFYCNVKFNDKPTTSGYAWLY